MRSFTLSSSFKHVSPPILKVDEVEKLLKASDEAPFRVLEHKALQEKFKVILKRRKVAASIDEMSSRTIDQV